MFISVISRNVVCSACCLYRVRRRRHRIESHLSVSDSSRDEPAFEGPLRKAVLEGHGYLVTPHDCVQARSMEGVGTGRRDQSWPRSDCLTSTCSRDCAYGSAALRGPPAQLLSSGVRQAVPSGGGSKGHGAPFSYRACWPLCRSAASARRLYVRDAGECRGPANSSAWQHSSIITSISWL